MSGNPLFQIKNINTVSKTNETLKIDPILNNYCEEFLNASGGQDVIFQTLKHNFQNFQEADQEPTDEL